MTFSLKPDGIRIAMEAEGTQELPETQLPVNCEESDGILFFTIRRNGGGVAG